ncbi:calcium-binding protein [Rhizobium alvei]|uniref:Calcium-binding protein n=1 Tax=Rhizobium alvei TaxID=1132659 RepID=A0ABT8YKT5_9HYPH|nr:calcium-binding protein [Rhizobium alvei]MDO6964280.1 calcium-binding protein [Rhizobium alvei]
MSVVTATKAFNVFNFDFSSFFRGSDYNGSATKFDVVYSSGNIDTFYGTNFWYDASGVLKSGTITGCTFSSGGEKPYIMKDLNYSAKAMYQAGLTEGQDDDDALIAVIFRGNDTIRGSSFDDRLDGFAGADSLYGNAGQDSLYGGAGNDKMWGGEGGDEFKFFNNSGNDRIFDFDAFGNDHDVVNLEFRTEIKNFNDLIDNHITRKDGFLLINLADGDTIRLDEVRLSNLERGDFMFG